MCCQTGLQTDSQTGSQSNGTTLHTLVQCLAISGQTVAVACRTNALVSRIHNDDYSHHPPLTGMVRQFSFVWWTNLKEMRTETFLFCKAFIDYLFFFEFPFTKTKVRVEWELLILSEFMKMKGESSRKWHEWDGATLGSGLWVRRRKLERLSSLVFRIILDGWVPWLSLGVLLYERVPITLTFSPSFSCYILWMFPP